MISWIITQFRHTLLYAYFISKKNKTKNKTYLPTLPFKVWVGQQQANIFLSLALSEEVDRFGRGCTMVWAAISNMYNRVANLVRVKWNLTAQWYRDDILQPHMLTLIDWQRVMFQQDNAWSHTASNYRFPNSEQHQSLDFNPIDHLWNEFHRVLGAHGGNNRYWPVGDCFYKFFFFFFFFTNLCLVSRYSCVNF